MATYALPESHKDVSGAELHTEEKTLTMPQLMEKSLKESDSEVAEIMVRRRRAVAEDSS
jgi:hypothetical protein